jgi:hypothetical protein
MREEKLTFDVCKEEALKYKTKSEFKKNSSTHYNKCVKNKWLSNVCSHMVELIKPKNYWTYERCKEEALKFSNRTDYSRCGNWSYYVALNNGWLDEICEHMIPKGSLKKRCIYVYEFKNNVAYIGLTYNFNSRWTRRKNDKNDVVYQYMQLTGETPIRKQLTDYIDLPNAQRLECEYVQQYKDDNWRILNRVKTGSLGGAIVKWTRDKCVDEISKYKSLFEFRESNNNCLSAIYKNGWLDLLTPLNKVKMSNNYWTKEKCFDAAKQCKTKKEFYLRFRGGYASSKKNNWFDEITSHM